MDCLSFFANPGLDIVQTEVPDILGAEQQDQVMRIVDALATFRPTKVAVEQLPSRASVLDSIFAAYRAGEHTLGRNEVEQLSFRIADRMGLPGVHPVDERGEFPFNAVMEYASLQDPAFVGEAMATIGALTEEMNRRHREWTIDEILRRMNEPDELVRGHGFYLAVSRVGGDDTQVGAELLSRWYERNIRIFARLQAIAEPGDRILFVVGQSHVPILRELVQGLPGFEVVDPLEFLPEVSPAPSRR